MSKPLNDHLLTISPSGEELGVKWAQHWNGVCRALSQEMRWAPVLMAVLPWPQKRSKENNCV